MRRGRDGISSRKKLSNGLLPHKIHNSQTQRQTFLQRPRAEVVLATLDIKRLFFPGGGAKPFFAHWALLPNRLAKEWGSTHCTMHSLGPETLLNLTSPWWLATCPSEWKRAAWDFLLSAFGWLALLCRASHPQLVTCVLFQHVMALAKPFSP